ncbi:MAG TPA: type II toxin-antitoxin system RelE/ParE family toxin [Nitrososphaera sp.]|nr:type II toxin-antitoxin system RelE/ParE family toxin [Nitrososphaera sp.]
MAQDDIIRQYRYYLVQEDSPVTAERFLKQVRIAINQLRKAPRIGQTKLLKNPKLSGLRSWPVNGFRLIRIYYVVRDCGLLVIRVLHSKRDVNMMLEDDLIEEL